LATLRLAEITSIRTSPSHSSFGPPKTRDPIVAAAQMRPQRSPRAQGPNTHCSSHTQGPSSTLPPTQQAFHDENILDREVKECVMQFRIQNKMKQDHLPAGLKVPRQTPMHARLPVANTAQTLTRVTEDFPHPIDDADNDAELTPPEHNVTPIPDFDS
jgi:hypothetical protein